MKRNILVITLMLLIAVMCFPMPVNALTYTQGYNSGKVAGYEQGYEEGYKNGYQEGYQVRSVESDNELTRAMILTSGVSITACVPLTALITAYFVSRRREKAHAPVTKRENSPSMNKVKKVCRCIGITFSIWLVSRFFPSVVGVLYPDRVALVCVLYIAVLIVGWAIAEVISKGHHPKCVKTNLYIIIFLEISGMLNTISKTLTSSYHATTDEYKGFLLFEVIYICLCFWITKQTAVAKVSTPGSK